MGLFYLVSAFTLFLSLDQRRSHESGPVRNFFIRRFFRIAPLFYCAILIYSLIYGPAPRASAPNGIQAWQYPITLLFLNGWHPESFNSIIPIEWSVAVEMTFYLIVPLLFGLLKNIKRATFFIIAALILQVALKHLLLPGLSARYPRHEDLVTFYLDYWFFAQLPVFGMGILAFQVYSRTRTIRNPDWGISLLTLACFLMIAFLEAGTYIDLIATQALYGIAFLCLLLSLHFHPVPILVNPLTRWIGKISFSIYLVHYAVIQYFVRFPPWLPPVGRTAGFLLTYLLVLGVTSGISFLTYQFIEVPGMNFGKRIIKQLEQRTQPTAKQVAG